MKKELKKSNKKNEKPLTNKEMLLKLTKIITDILKREFIYHVCFVAQLIVNILMFALIIKK